MKAMTIQHDGFGLVLGLRCVRAGLGLGLRLKPGLARAGAFQVRPPRVLAPKQQSHDIGRFKGVVPIRTAHAHKGKQGLLGCGLKPSSSKSTDTSHTTPHSSS